MIMCKKNQVKILVHKQYFVWENIFILDDRFFSYQFLKLFFFTKVLLKSLMTVYLSKIDNPKCYLAYLLRDPNYAGMSKWVKCENLHKIPIPMLKKRIGWDRILYLIIQIFSLISKCTPWLLTTRYSRSLKTIVLWTIRIRSMSMISTMIILQDVRFSLTFIIMFLLYQIHLLLNKRRCYFSWLSSSLCASKMPRNSRLMQPTIIPLILYTISMIQVRFSVFEKFNCSIWPTYLSYQ